MRTASPRYMPIDNRRYTVAQTASLLYRRLL